MVNAREDSYDDLSLEHIFTRKISRSIGKDTRKGRHGDSSDLRVETQDAAEVAEAPVSCHASN